MYMPKGNDFKTERFNPHVWIQDYEKLAPYHKDLADEIMRFACEDLGTRIRHQPAAYNTGKATGITVFDIEKTRNVLFVFRIAKTKFDILIRDWNNAYFMVGGIPIVEGPGRQWTAKREKSFTVPHRNDVAASMVAPIKELLTLIHDDVERHHLSGVDSTKNLSEMFGKATGLNKDNRNKFPKRGLRRQLLEEAGYSCHNCKSRDNISFCQDNDAWIVLCDKHLAEHAYMLSFTCDIVPHEVRSIVWHRDFGKCVSCGSTHQLAMGHFIPKNRGKRYEFSGSNGHFNIQLLCQSCNSSESNNLIDKS